MKKRNKIILIVMITIFSIFIINGNIDYSRVKKGKKPLLSIYIGKSKNDSIERWIGFGYTVTKCPNSSSNSDSIYNDDGKYKVSILSMRTVCVTSFDVEILPAPDYKIVDNNPNCKTALEEIARDKKFIYYLGCIKSKKIFLEYENGDKITLKESLDNHKVTINNLIDKGLDIYQKKIIE